jgi:hypothetical protein
VSSKTRTFEVLVQRHPGTFSLMREVYGIGRNNLQKSEKNIVNGMR